MAVLHRKPFGAGMEGEGRPSLSRQKPTGETTIESDCFFDHDDKKRFGIAMLI